MSNTLNKTVMNFENVYASYQNEIQSLITKKVGMANKELAEELTNDVFMRVHKHLDNFDSDKSSLRTWLYNIANRIVIDYWRKNSLETMSMHKEDDEGNEIFQFESTSLTPHAEMVNSELGEKIMNAINGLSDTYKELSTKFFIQEKSYDEIASELNVPVGTVKGKLNRARTKLQTVL